jgi:hypothetical protein
MNKITGIAVLTTAEGTRITYTYSVINESTGSIVQSNIKKSFVVLNEDTQNTINALKTDVENHLASLQ